MLSQVLLFARRDDAVRCAQLASSWSRALLEACGPGRPRPTHRSRAWRSRHKVSRPLTSGHRDPADRASSLCGDGAGVAPRRRYHYLFAHHVLRELFFIAPEALLTDLTGRDEQRVLARILGSGGRGFAPAHPDTRRPVGRLVSSGRWSNRDTDPIADARGASRGPFRGPSPRASRMRRATSRWSGRRPPTPCRPTRWRCWVSGWCSRAGGVVYGPWRSLPDGRLASGGEDGAMLAVAGRGRGEPVVLRRHGGGVGSLAVAADGRLASGGMDGRCGCGRRTARASRWCSRTAQAVSGRWRCWPGRAAGQRRPGRDGSGCGRPRQRRAAGPARARAGSGRWRRWRTGGWPAAARTGRMRSVAGGRPAASRWCCAARRRSVCSVAFAPDGRLASGGDADGRYWCRGSASRWHSGQLVSSLVLPPVQRRERDRSGGWPVIACRDAVGLACVRRCASARCGVRSAWRARSEPLSYCAGTRGVSGRLAFAPDGRLASGGADGTVPGAPDRDARSRSWSPRRAGGCRGS